ncbi:Mu-like prophage major head subunit gpT family protein [Shinella sp. 838]|uniref:prohead protease/major capsid protein fusion protein n=1 Tax=Shinella sp. 838 TaxID=3038164 RepID=UPI0024151BD5|nr:prohead protease/major capsid protein fusion protein [Shinella sp. 838]MDG4671632.1 Mu-like prophage major head subunit gpT family protein [Shinella sp. 838]
MTDHNGPFTRAAPLRASSWNAETLTFDLVLSAGAAVERGGFIEVLDIAGATWPDTVPLLDSHRQGSLDDNLGDVTNIRREGGEIVGTVRLSKHSEKAKRIAAELSDGRSFSASIGYTTERWAESNPAGKRTLTAKAWTIKEASLVSVPADPSSKIRSNPLTTTTTQTRAEINQAIRAAAKAAGLDQAFIDQHVDAESDIATVNAAALEALAARSQAAGTIRTTAKVGEDHSDPEAIRSAMSDALAHRLAPAAVKLEGRATEFRGHAVLDLVGDLAVARGERVNLRDREALLQRAVGAHSTSDFPLLMAAAANKALLAQYQVAAPTYRSWSARKPFSDFKAHSFLRVGDVPAFTEINEAGEVKYGTISENAEKVTAKEYGTGIAIGRKALINDDLSALSDFSSGIAIRAANDENRMAYALLAANGALSDTKALFHADHGNLAASGSAIDATSIGLAVAALRAQKSLDGMVLNLQPAFLVVGPAYETAARLILASINATKASDVNIWSGFATLVVDANITGNAWYLFASPSAAPVVVYGYVGGVEGPQVRSERDFDTQAVKVAASLDFAVGAIDYRGAYKNAGA